MAQFKDVFSITAKVILSLFIISAAMGVGFLILGGLGSAIAPSNANPLGAPGEDEADAVRNTMPAPAWDSVIVKAVTNQCVTDGMSKGEVLRAIGAPDLRYDGPRISSWTWHPRKASEATMFFTAKGNVYLWGSGCKSLSGSVPP
jgi:hypothetical protein